MLPTESQVVDYVTNNPGCGSIDVAQHFGCSVSDINRSRAGYSGIYKLRTLINIDYRHYPKTEDALWTAATLQDVFDRPVFSIQTMESVKESLKLREQMCAKLTKANTALTYERDVLSEKYDALIAMIEERDALRQQLVVMGPERELPTTSDVHPKIKAHVRRPTPEVPQCAVCLENFVQEWKLQNRRRCCSAKFCHACERRTIDGPCPVCRHK